MKKKPQVLTVVLLAICILLLSVTLFSLLEKFNPRQWQELQYSMNRQVSNILEPRVKFTYKKAKGIFASGYSKLPKELESKRSDKWNNLECVNLGDLNTGENKEGLATPELLSKDLQDKSLDFGIEQIEKHQYSDMEILTVDSSALHVFNQDKKSQKNVYFQDICKDDQYYYVLFYTQEKRVSSSWISLAFAGGGGPPGVFNFVVINKTGKISVMIEDLSQIARKIATTKNPILSVKVGNQEYSRSDHDLAYQGCYGILGVLRNTAYISCAGGEGGGFRGDSIYTIDLKKKIVEEIAVYLDEYPPEDPLHKVISYDKVHKIYFKDGSTITTTDKKP